MSPNSNHPTRDAVRQSLGMDAESQARLADFLSTLRARVGAIADSRGKVFALLEVLGKQEGLTARDRAWLIFSLLETNTIDVAAFGAVSGFCALLPDPHPVTDEAPPEMAAAPAPQTQQPADDGQTAPSVTGDPVLFLVGDDGKPVEPKSITTTTDDWLEAARRDFVYKVLETEPEAWIEIVDELKKDASLERISAILTDSLISPDDKELPSKLFLWAVVPLAVATFVAAIAAIYEPLIAVGIAVMVLRITTSIDENGALLAARRLVPFPGLFPKHVLARLREPLYFYLYRNFPASLSQKLLPYIPKIAQLANQDGQNALHVAALDVDPHVVYDRHIVVDMFTQLLDRRMNTHKKVSARYIEQLISAGLDPLTKDVFGKTSIDYLFANAHADAIRALFIDETYGPAIWRYKDALGRNVLHLAIIFNLPSIINILVAKAEHKDEFIAFLECQDNFKRKPVDYITNKYPRIGPIGEITVTAFETAYAKTTGNSVGWRAKV